jgi:hypothetical protein
VSEDGILAVNGKFVSLDENLPHAIFGMFNLTKSIMGSKKKILVYNLELPSNESIQIRANLKSRMLFVDVNGVFPGSEGLLGAPAEEDKPGSVDSLLIKHQKGEENLRSGVVLSSERAAFAAETP